ncbi:MAG: NAD(P)H-binding protein [Candidatus Thorarchaeota archaeon]|nr:MAG: NAD(P)H-binding protein [Candidatus Thorarchaeota archaeon]
MRLERILVLGATGYVGSRLVLRLLSEGYRVRASWRSENKLLSCSWSDDPRVELVQTDVRDQESLYKAVEGCHAAFYLIHSMYAGSRFSQMDTLASKNMVETSRDSDLQRIVYLGGLGTTEDSLSPHLRSRAKVGRILQSGPVPVTILRAAMILGAGSASFEILRYLVERLPLMTTPRWVRTNTQPIAISNALEYLVKCLDEPDTSNRTLDIGGPAVTTYESLMKVYAEVAGLVKRVIIPIPLLTPSLSSYWLKLVTPVPLALARPLIESLRNETVCESNEIRTLIPQRLLSYREAFRRALADPRRKPSSSYPESEVMPFVPEWAQPSDPRWASGPSLRLPF